MEIIYATTSQVMQHNRNSSANRLARQGEWEGGKVGKRNKMAELEHENRALKKTINSLVQELAAAKGRT